MPNQLTTSGLTIGSGTVGNIMSVAGSTYLLTDIPRAITFDRTDSSQTLTADQSIVTLPLLSVGESRIVTLRARSLYNDGSGFDLPASGVYILSSGEKLTNLSSYPELSSGYTVSVGQSKLSFIVGGSRAFNNPAPGSVSYLYCIALFFYQRVL